MQYRKSQVGYESPFSYYSSTVPCRAERGLNGKGNFARQKHAGHERADPVASSRAYGLPGLRWGFLLNCPGPHLSTGERGQQELIGYSPVVNRVPPEAGTGRVMHLQAPWDQLQRQPLGINDREGEPRVSVSGQVKYSSGVQVSVSTADARSGKSVRPSE